jgi:hypothetical protein
MDNMEIEKAFVLTTSWEGSVIELKALLGRDKIEGFTSSGAYMDYKVEELASLGIGMKSTQALAPSTLG